MKSAQVKNIGKLIKKANIRPKPDKELTYLNAQQTETIWQMEIGKENERKQRTPGVNISYPSSAVAVVFGGHLSARATFRLDRKPPAIRPCV
jgi:hypothetical protein